MELCRCKCDCGERAQVAFQGGKGDMYCLSCGLKWINGWPEHGQLLLAIGKAA